MALSFFLILLPGLPVKNSLPVEQTHSANIISFSIYENENEPRLDDFLPLFVCFGTKIFSQHQTSTTLLGLVRENRATPVLTRSLVRSPTSTPKPRAEGSSPSAPAKNSATAFAVALFFVMAVGETEARVACRGALVAGGDRPAPTEAAAETSPSLDFLLAFQVFLSVRTCPQPCSSPPAPETHPVSPFLAQIGCVFLFFAVFWPQNFRLGFCATCHIVFTS